jgi:hypothetical protein
LQSKIHSFAKYFFPPNLSSVFYNLAGKNLIFKRVNLLCKEVFCHFQKPNPLREILGNTVVNSTTIHQKIPLTKKSKTP